MDAFGMGVADIVGAAGRALARKRDVARPRDRAQEMMLR
jgi:hypothetical protein